MDGYGFWGRSRLGIAKSKKPKPLKHRGTEEAEAQELLNRQS
jgi:hypothetical protein